MRNQSICVSLTQKEGHRQLPHSVLNDLVCFAAIIHTLGILEEDQAWVEIVNSNLDMFNLRCLETFRRCVL